VHSPLWYVGILLDCVATLAGTGGKQLLRYAVVKNNAWYYPLGLLCTAVIDPAFDVSAYSFAAQSIIAPMGGMVVVWNIAIAPYTLGEALTRSRVAGAVLIIVGTLIVGLAGNHEDTKRSVDEYLALFARGEAVLYYVLLTLWCAVCGYYWRHGSPFVSGFYVGAFGGSLAGNMFTTKAVVEMIKCITTGDQTDPCDQTSCAYNPFFTVWPCTRARSTLADAPARDVSARLSCPRGSRVSVPLASTLSARRRATLHGTRSGERAARAARALPLHCDL
jgi:uncharacterized membrane protein